MVGVCGWLAQTDDVDSKQLLGQMSARLAGAQNFQQEIIPLAAIAATGGSVAQNGGVIAVVAGADSNITAAMLLERYQREGKQCVKGLAGGFFLAILDSQQQTALLAIDRLGIQRICYGAASGKLVFGTTCDSVASHPAIGNNLNTQGIFNYLYHHMVPAPGTVYQGVQKLLPGQYLFYQNGKVEKGFYWQPDWSVEQKSFAEYQQTFKQLLRDSVAKRLDQQSIGAFLSGGTDSSTVAGTLTQVSGKPAQTFSIGFDAEGFDEMEYARIAVKHFGTNPHEYYVTPDDVVSAIPLIAAAYDEPFGNASAMPTYFCALKGKEAGMDVLLAGDGGDEVFGGNERYAKQKVFEMYGQVPELLRHMLVEPLAGVFAGVPKLSKLQSYVRQANVPLPDRLETYNFLHNTALDKIFTPEFLRGINPDEPLLNMREVYARAGSDDFVNRMLFLDWKQTLADNDLRKVNRMCELAGVEVRYPLLDDDLVAFASKLPVDYKVKGSYLRWFFKEALRDFLPKEIIDKSKHGFGLPFGVWMQRHDPLRELAYASLQSFRQRGIVRAEYLDELQRQHQTGHASYYGVMIWVIMMLEQWLQAHGHK